VIVNVEDWGDGAATGRPHDMASLVTTRRSTLVTRSALPCWRGLNVAASVHSPLTPLQALTEQSPFNQANTKTSLPVQAKASKTSFSSLFLSQ